MIDGRIVARGRQLPMVLPVRAWELGVREPGERLHYGPVSLTHNDNL